MFCPDCSRELGEPAEVCPTCSFSLQKCEHSFPFGAPPLELVIDPSNLLPSGIAQGLDKAYRKLRRRIPQVDISFCFVWLQPGVSLESFAFWLHNTAPDADSQRAWQLLVVGDRTSGRLTMTSGYALEPFLKRKLWEAALQELAACLSDEQWKEGLNGFLIDTRDLLTAAWYEAEKRRPRNHSTPDPHGPQASSGKTVHESSRAPAQNPRETSPLLAGKAPYETSDAQAKPEPAIQPS